MRTQIPAQHLQLGMYVAALDVPWEKTDFPFQGFVLNSERDLKLIRSGCVFVYIDSERSSDPASVATIIRTLSGPKETPEVQTKRRFSNFRNRWGRRTPPDNRQPKQATKSDIKNEIERANVLRQHARTHISQMLQDARLGTIIDGDGAKSLVSSMVDSVVRNPDALMLVTQLKKRDEYTAMHSFNVCVLSIAFGRHLKMKRNALLELGLAGLMHDVGKIRVPLDILNKPEKLSDSEFAEMKKHTIYGGTILSAAPSVLSSTIEVALTHHERLKGQGYPRGLHEDDLGTLARMVAIVDMYDAITSDRVYHEGASVVDALEILYKSRADSLDQRLVDNFIQSIGIYPVGTLVELSNREVGIVVSSLPESRLKPKVLVVMDENKRPFRPHRIIDLAVERQSSGRINVKRALNPGAYNIRVSDLVDESSW